MKNVTGIFDSKFEADRAVSQLLTEGFTNSDVSLIVSETGRKTLFHSDTAADTEAANAAKGGITGAAIGGALGALVAGLTAVGSIVVSGGSLLVAGPIVALLSGLGAGGLVGGLTGALIKAGYSEDEAAMYEKELNAGKAIVTVHVDSDAKEARARSALRVAGATTKVA